MTSTTLASLLASALAASAAFAGPDIDEATSTQPDAGGVPQVAKVGKGSSTTSILRATGTTSTPSSAVIGGDIVDMFIVRVSSPSTFSATTVGSADFDTMLYLCSITLDASNQPSQAWVITGNDNASTGTTGSTVTFPSPSTAYAPGVYAIVVTTARTMPIGLVPSSTGGTPPTQAALLNYASTGLMTQTASGPDYPVKLWLPLGGSLAAGGSYSVQLTSVTTISPLGGSGYCGSIVAGSCYTEHPTSRGCDGYQCCQLVCSLDSACCSIGWDATCAELAVQNCPSCPDTAPACLGDLNEDGAVDGSDLGEMLSRWGTCS
jgi:hypothetical protein